MTRLLSVAYVPFVIITIIFLNFTYTKSNTLENCCYHLIIQAKKFYHRSTLKEVKDAHRIANSEYRDRLMRSNCCRSSLIRAFTVCPGLLFGNLHSVPKSFDLPFAYRQNKGTDKLRFPTGCLELFFVFAA